MNEPFFRLAVRTEGKLVNCYFARPNTMAGSILLGSISRKMLECDPELFEKWKNVMTAGMNAMVKEVLGGEIPNWITEDAPEHEKGGDA